MSVDQHYQKYVRVKITDEDIANGYVTVKLDPYIISLAYEVPGGPQEHILKKCLRGTTKGHTEEELVAEVDSSLMRWKELVSKVSLPGDK